MVYDLVSENDKCLVTETKPFDFENPPIDPILLFSNLKETMIANKGIGLSANQVGIPYSVFVMGTAENPDAIIPCFNPKILATWGDSKYMEEGCLSFPKLIIKVKRHEFIRVRYTVATGDTNAIKFEGMSSRIFQHECDHLDGITFKKRATRYHLEKGQKLRRQFNRQVKSLT